jgi:hypothetical protein
VTNVALSTITECPLCRAALALPSDAAVAGELECPACDARFVLTTAMIREVRMARIAPAPQSPPIADDAAWRLSELLAPDAPAEIVTKAEPAPSFLSELPLAAEAAELLEPAAAAPSQPPDELRTPAEIDFVDPAATTVAIGPESTIRFDDEVYVEEERVEEFADADEAATDDFDLEPVYEPSRVHAGYEDAQHADDDFAQADDFAHADEDDESDHQFDLRPAPRPRRRRPSTVRTLVGIVGGGVMGILLAGYALLWFRGPSGDLLQMAPWLPQAMLPSSMQSAVQSTAAEVLPPRVPRATPDVQGASLADASNDNPPGDEATAGGDLTASDDMQVDPEVSPASSTEPVIAESTSPIAPDQAPTPTLPAPPVKPKWPTTPIVADLIDPRLFSLQELSEAAAAAESAGRRFVAGDLARPDTVRDMGQAYVQLCAAAERMTLTDPSSYGASLFTQQALAKDPINLAAGNSARRRDLAVIAARWLQHTKRQNEGTLFVGRVRDMTAQGAWTEYHIEIDLGDQKLSVPVLMDSVKFATGAEVAIAGVIVKDPQQHLAGYQGDAPQIVIAGYAFDPARYANADAAEAPAFELPGS